MINGVSVVFGYCRIKVDVMSGFIVLVADAWAIVDIFNIAVHRA
jgi:hypothetical protein